MAADKDLKKLVKAIEAEPGWAIRVTSRQHILVTKNGKPVTTMAGTPSDWRGMKNVLADLRRAGFDWPR